MCHNRVIFLVIYATFCFTIVHGLQQYKYHFSRLAELLPKQPDRQNARSEVERTIAIHLYEGDVIYIDLCTQGWTNFSFSNLTYSNDGASDNVSIHFDSRYLGHFTTHSFSNWGNYWDKFFGSGYLGNTGMVPPGKHVITIHVRSSGDCYGVEFGMLSLETKKLLNESMLWCGEKHAAVNSQCLPRAGDKAKVVDKAVISLPPSSTIPEPPMYIEVRQLSYKSNCIDKQNVIIAFSGEELVGTNITVRQRDLSTLENGHMSTRTTSRGRECKSSLWQLGNIDANNSEFGNIYPAESYSVNISDFSDATPRFPAKLLPFLTKEITLRFEIPKDLNIKEGSAFFVLGLVNLTSNSRIGLQVNDPNTGLSSERVDLMFTPARQVMGWHLPYIRRSPASTKSEIKIHIFSEANVIMFDFLKLDYSLREERKQNSLIARTTNMKVRGLRYVNSVGAAVIVDDRPPAYNVEDIVIYHKQFSRYRVVLRIHFSGALYPYKSYNIRRQSDEQQMVDVSGFVFSSGVPALKDGEDTISNNISSIFISTATDLILINYSDGSVVKLKLTSSFEITQLTVVGFEARDNQISRSGIKSLYFLSTHVNDDIAAVNDIEVPGVKVPIISESLGLSGDFDYTISQRKPSSVFYANNLFNIQFPLRRRNFMPPNKR